MTYLVDNGNMNVVASALRLKLATYLNETMLNDARLCISSCRIISLKFCSSLFVAAFLTCFGGEASL